MPNIYDVWVNWVNGREKSYNIPEFHEWKRTDEVELIASAPVFLITPEVFNSIESTFNELPIELREAAHEKACCIKNNGRHYFECLAIISDGDRVLAVNAEDKKVPLLKSKLIPRHEKVVLNQVSSIPVLICTLEHKEDEVEETTALDKIVNITSEQMIGLTRKEKQLKEILMDCLFSLGCTADREELKYWVIELHPKMYGDSRLDEVEEEELVLLIHETLKMGWNSTHIEFGNNLVKYYSTSKDIWEKLMKEDNLVKK